MSRHCTRSLVLVAILGSLIGARPAQGQGASHMAAAKELFTLMQVGETMLATMESAFDQQAKMNPELAQYQDVMMAWGRKIMLSDEAIGEFLKAYAGAFSEKDIREMIAFYKTPVGQKLVAKQPELAKQGAAIGARMAETHQAELQEMIQARAAELEKEQ